jgi:cell fate regulator YaaT (PSP1 superfamily)
MTGSCEKLGVFDWLGNMQNPTGQETFDVYEVRFKNGRKLYCRNTKGLDLCMGDVITVEGSPGHDVGVISLKGELVRVQLQKKKIDIEGDQIRKIYRKASQKDIDIWQEARAKEEETQRQGREIIQRLGLKMKLSDVEYQGDGNKAIFYYTADERVDFRQLIRDLAGAFGIRIEMKQVGLRQEASRLGGIGSCGRELCCSTWLTDFRKVNTASARYQQLALNPQKLSGQCGKLKCCLNFELDSYLDALKEFPETDVVLKTEKGPAVYVKMDIFKGLMWYTYKEDRSKWYKLTLEQVLEVIELNEQGKKIASLEDLEEEFLLESAVEEIDFEKVVGQDDLTRFDQPKRSRNKRRNKNRSRQNSKNTRANQGQQKQGSSKTEKSSDNKSEKADSRENRRKRPSRNRSNSKNKSQNNPQSGSEQQGNKEGKKKPFKKRKPQNKKGDRPNKGKEGNPNRKPKDE